jgi:hypothetical protein
MIPTARGSRRVRDVLVVNPQDSVALGAAAVNEGPNRRARATATGALIAARALELLDDDLGSMLASAVELQRDVIDAAWESRDQPDTPVVVDLFELAEIPVTTMAELVVLVDEVVKAEVTVTLSIVFGLAELQAEIQNGWLIGLAGQQSVTGTLTVDTVRIGHGSPMPVDYTVAERRRSAGWGPVRLPRRIPLAAATP